MPALSDRAVQAVKGIVASAEEAPETGGLRVIADHVGAQVNLQLGVVALPGEDDEVIEAQGARMFLEPEDPSLLEDKLLDTTLEQNEVASRSRIRSSDSRTIDLAVPPRRTGRAALLQPDTNVPGARLRPPSCTHEEK
jgi:iron-sulfur cluster assembly protein